MFLHKYGNCYCLAYKQKLEMNWWNFLEAFIWPLKASVFTKILKTIFLMSSNYAETPISGKISWRVKFKMVKTTIETKHVRSAHDILFKRVLEKVQNWNRLYCCWMLKVSRSYSVFPAKMCRTKTNRARLRTYPCWCKKAAKCVQRITNVWRLDQSWFTAKFKTSSVV